MTAAKTKTIQRMLAGISRRVEQANKARSDARRDLDIVITIAMKLKKDLGAEISSKKKGKPALQKRRLSPEARERIASAARKRWAAYRKAKKKKG